MSNKGSVLVKIVIMLGVIASAAVLITVICKKMKNKKQNPEEEDDIEKEAMNDFEECCDACFSEGNE